MEYTTDTIRLRQVEGAQLLMGRREAGEGEGDRCFVMLFLGLSRCFSSGDRSKSRAFASGLRQQIGIDRAKRGILLERRFKKVDFTTNRDLEAG